MLNKKEDDNSCMNRNADIQCSINKNLLHFLFLPTFKSKTCSAKSISLQEMDNYFNTSINFGFCNIQQQIKYAKLITNVVQFANWFKIVTAETCQKNGFIKCSVKRFFFRPLILAIKIWKLASTITPYLCMQFGITWLVNPSKTL
jgi:hypothetical protein